MNPNYVTSATNQVSPVFNQQTAALQKQLPAINMLYQALSGQLDASGQSQRQNIYEDSSGRGLLKSTIPIDAETALASSLVSQRAQLGSQQLKDTGAVQNQIAQVGINKANAISELVRSLFGMDSNQMALEQQRAEAERAYQLSLQRLRQGIF